MQCPWQWKQFYVVLQGSLFNWGIFHLGLSDLDFLFLINVLVDVVGSLKRTVHTQKRGRKRRQILLLALVDHLQICLHDCVVRNKSTMYLCDYRKASCLQYPQLCAAIAPFPWHPPSALLNNQGKSQMTVQLQTFHFCVCYRFADCILITELTSKAIPKMYQFWVRQRMLSLREIALTVFFVCFLRDIIF